MFTGIVENTGQIRSSNRDTDGIRLRIASPFESLNRGQSISVNGACLTVERYGDDWFEVFLSDETVARTYLSDLEAGQLVNLERALPADGRLDGHIVQGHVDDTAEIRDIDPVGDDWLVTVSLPTSLQQYVVEKGSIAVDGISLTVASRTDDTFSTAVIPETYSITHLSEKQVGEPVHLEVDVIAKYVENMTENYV